MKGRVHVILTLFTAFPLLFGVSMWVLINSTMLIEDKLIFISAAAIFLLIGAILPDSDSEDKGSMIFHTAFALIAVVVNYAETYIAKKLGMRVGHRKSLHTFKGVLLSSLLVIFFFSIILTLVYKFSFTISIVSYFFLALGQLLHLLQDKIDNPLVYFGMLVLVIVVSYGISLKFFQHKTDNTKANEELNSVVTVITNPGSIQDPKILNKCERVCKENTNTNSTRVIESSRLRLYTCFCENGRGYSIDSSNYNLVTESEIEKRSFEGTIVMLPDRNTECVCHSQCNALLNKSTNTKLIKDKGCLCLNPEGPFVLISTNEYCSKYSWISN
jgi:hypothetical protein